MARTDLDWLSDEASPEEVKRLMRIAHEWSQGDEYSFPVQLALLTRAQWRSAAQIPRLLDESRALLDLKLNDYRQQIATLMKNFSEATDAQVEAMARIVTDHSQSVVRTTSGMGEHLAKASRVAQQIGDELQRGATEWQDARREFEAERKRLEVARQELEKRRTWDESITLGMVLLAMIGLGIAIGLGLRRGGI